ncbi:hypothetical protein DH2020_022938 [Rehmannia glutinosa]|uniref:Uncharacterized protein n=1 Tax=Rehmannia glutinosa TaxID=99300 RepID=A0ABR0W8Z1_REHGL
MGTARKLAGSEGSLNDKKNFFAVAVAEEEVVLAVGVDLVGVSVEVVLAVGLALVPGSRRRKGLRRWWLTAGGGGGIP